MRFLIDECCAERLTTIAHTAGFEAYHVIERGLAGSPDHELKRIILREDFTFVTNNAADFLRIYGETPLHAGLIVRKSNVSRDQQRELFSSVMAELASREITDLVNRVVEVDFEGVRIYDLPHEQWPIGFDGVFPH